MEILRMKPWVKHKCTSGLITAKEVKSLLNTNHVVDAFHKQNR